MKRSRDGLSPFGRLLGIGDVMCVEATNKRCRLVVRPGPDHANDAGLVHGGFIQAVFDEVGRQFAARLWQRGITIVATVSFERAARINQPLTFEMEERVGGFIGKATSAGTVIATYSGTWQSR